MAFSVLLLGFLPTLNLSLMTLPTEYIHNDLNQHYSLLDNHKQSSEEFPTTENEDFVFQLTNRNGTCARLSDQSTRCDFLIQNKINERNLVIYGNYGAKSTRIIDTSGNEALASKVTIGSKSNRAYVQTRVLRNVPIKASIVFDGLITNTDQIKVIDISASASDRNSRIATFQAVIDLK